MTPSRRKEIDYRCKKWAWLINLIPISEALCNSNGLFLWIRSIRCLQWMHEKIVAFSWSSILGIKQPRLTFSCLFMSGHSEDDIKCLARPSSGTRKKARIPGDYSTAHSKSQRVWRHCCVGLPQTLSRCPHGMKGRYMWERTIAMDLCYLVSWVSKGHHVTKMRKPRHSCCHRHLTKPTNLMGDYLKACMSLLCGVFLGDPKGHQGQIGFQLHQGKNANLSLIQNRGQTLITTPDVVSEGVAEN